MGLLEPSHSRGYERAEYYASTFVRDWGWSMTNLPAKCECAVD